MAISFNQVPSTVRVPFAYIEFDSSRAVQGLNALEYSVLLLGQKLDTGTADAGELVLLSSAEQAAEQALAIDEEQAGVGRHHLAAGLDQGATDRLIPHKKLDFRVIFHSCPALMR